MTDLASAAAGATVSVVGTATHVIYAAAVVLSSQGIGFANTGSAPVIDHTTLGVGALLGTSPAAVLTGGVLLTPGGPSPGLNDFLHANLDPHTTPLVQLVGQVLHG